MAKSRAAQRVINTLPKQIQPWFEGEKAFVVQPDGSVIEAEWGDGKPTLTQMQKAVGGYIQMVPFGAVVPRWKMVCDEDGLLKSYAPNPQASLLCKEQGHYLVGPVVFTRHM